MFPHINFLLPQKQRGNALFLILIAVALFAALSYALTQSGRGSGNIDNERAQIDAAVTEQCLAAVEYGVNKLQVVGGCPAAQISYELERKLAKPVQHGMLRLPCGWRGHRPLRSLS